MSNLVQSVASLMAHCPSLEDYDLGQRPLSYWNQPETMLLATIRAEHLRQQARHELSSGGVEASSIGTLGAEIDGEFQKMLERTHPIFMGGAYLPDFQPWEVEIARVVMDSTTRDVVSLRAAPDVNRIAYRMVDEYMEDGGFFVLPIESSQIPLCMAEVIEILVLATNTNWDKTRLLNLREINGNYPNFLQFSSEYYPELGAFFAEEEVVWQQSVDRGGRWLKYTAFGG